MSSTLRPRTVPEILDASFRVLRTHYGSFVLLSALAGFPYWAVLWLSGIYSALADPTIFAARGFSLAGGAAMGFWILLAGVWWVVGNAAIVVAASDAYLGNEVVPARALAAAIRRWWRVLGAGILKGIAIFFGYFLILIGAIWMACRYFATVQVVLLEDRPVVRSFNRSVELADGDKWRIFGGLAIAWLVYIVISTTLSAVLGLFQLPLLASAALRSLTYIFVSPIVGIVSTLLYYDMRIRKEALDLELMASQLDAGAHPAPAPTGG
ncbi:MAG TPA: hypothetical protein VFS44_14835 [Gemmatimonadaceae bacterium]|nr:hypothetical protein [Gemmatimonadaceae bacterium]